MSRAYYNENNKFCAQWLRNLIAAELLQPGDVDDRSIVDVRAADLRGYAQCHFFAGIGGWPYALRLAEWPDARKAWSASVPCQPWSRARIYHKERERERDERDLWPIFFALVKQLRPTIVFGEQVTGIKVMPWIARLRKDFFASEYDLFTEQRKAFDHGSSQLRPRYYFSAHLDSARRERLVTSRSLSEARIWRWRSKEDLRAIAGAPFEPGDRWPQPLLRSGDARVPRRMDIIRGYGNAIDPWVAADFIQATANPEQRQPRFGGY